MKKNSKSVAAGVKVTNGDAPGVTHKKTRDREAAGKLTERVAERRRPPISSEARRGKRGSRQRRKDAYEALHPETKAGSAGANARWNGDPTANLATASFADDQAEKTGGSVRSIRRDAERRKDPYG